MKLQPKSIGPVTLTARGHGFLVAQTLKNWQQSGRAEIGPQHVPRDGKLLDIPAAIWVNAAAGIVTKAREAWERGQKIGDEIPLGFDGFLKLWAMGKPQLQGDYILLDEAQDTNGVVLELIRHQKAQVVCVGDRWQAIYEWRGAVNAMVELPSEIERRLSTSFRFGPAIAGYATTVLDLLGETLPLTGNPARESVLGAVENPRAILYRTNSRLIEDLLSLIERDQKPYVVGGVDETMQFVAGAEKLMAGQATESPFELFGFNDWQEVQAAAHTDGGEELRRWVNLIDKYGTAGLRRALERLPKREEEASVVLSTGHKSKGREWDSVRLQDDFLLGVKAGGDDGQEQPDPRTGELPLKKTPRVPLEELRLLYVAATRGQTKLEVSPMIDKKLDRVREIIAQREAA
jgi:superfamily I DNA/RNA helicase